MNRIFLLLIAFFLIPIIAIHADLEFSRDPTWPGKLPEGWKYRMVSSIAGDSKGRIYVAHRGEHPIIIFDKKGKFLGSLGDDLFEKSMMVDATVDPPTPISREYWIHEISVDSSDNLWVADYGRQVVLKISPQGKLLMMLGTLNKSGNDSKTFYQPTSAVVGPDGCIYVADGYGNSRIVKFSPEGKYLKAWGKKGSRPGELNLPHAITVDAQGRVYVAERVNNRIEVFDSEGHFLAQWPNLQGTGCIIMTHDGNAYVGVGGDDIRIVKVDLTGKLIQAFGKESTLDYAHGMFEDSEGSLYIADPDADNASRPPRKFVRSIVSESGSNK